MILICFYKLLLILLWILSFTSQRCIAQNELATFLNESLNHNIAPCDKFYDFSCGNHPSSSISKLMSSIQETLLKSIQEDEKYPSVSKAMLDYIDDCVLYMNNNTYKSQTVERYLNSVFFTCNFLQNEISNYFESLLKLIFIAPQSLDAISLTQLQASYDAQENRLNILANPIYKDTSGSSFHEKMMQRYGDYMRSTSSQNHDELSLLYLQKSQFQTFVNNYWSIVNKPSKSNIFAIPMESVCDKLLHDAIVNSAKCYIDEEVDLTNLNVTLDVEMFDELNQLFLTNPRETKDFLIILANLTISSAVGILATARSGTETSLVTRESCLNNALDPEVTGAIFNLYAANLLVRNRYPMTTIQEELAVRNITESIRSGIRNSLMHTSWLKNDREMLRNIDSLLNISKAIGFPDVVYEEEKLSLEFNRFTGFNNDEDMIQKIIRLRILNTRMKRRNLGVATSYFELNAFFGPDANKLELLHSILLPPFYSKDYPLSYNYGLLGSTIGHEFFHRFSPPDNPSRWQKFAALNETVDCYTNFYNGICYNLTQETEAGEMEENEVCADGESHLNENIADVEGTRVAFQGMKTVIGESRLKERAMAEFDFTNDQLFFIGYAQFYCNANMKDDGYFSEKLRDANNPHTAYRVRVDAVFMQMEEFRTAFSCKSRDSMVIQKDQICYLLPSDEQ